MKTVLRIILLCILLAMLALSACAEADGTLTLPGNLTEIGEEAFTGLEAAQTVIVPPTVTKIGARAFSGCGAVSVILPDALEDIAEDAFAEGSAIAVAKAGSKALAACAEKNIPRLSYSVEDDGVTVVKFRGDSLRVIIPAAIEGKPVKRIAAFAFEALHELAGVVIPDTVTSIGEKAFNDCYALEEADLPAGLTELGPYAFRFNEKLRGVVIPSGITELNEGVFYACKSLESARLPETMKTVGEYAFSRCAKLKTVNFPDGLTALKKEAFSGTWRDQAEETVYYIPAGLEDASNAFYGSGAVICISRGHAAETKLREDNNIFAYHDAPDFRYRMDYFNHERKLGLYGYAGSDSPVRLPDDCEGVRYDGFKDLVAGGLVCAQLSKTSEALSQAGLNFTFPGHEDIRYRVIDGVLYVMGYEGTGTAIIIPEATEYIAAGYDEQIRAAAFVSKENITKTVIPEGVTRINGDAYSGCYALTDITLPNSLKSMDQKVFRYCGQNEEAPFYLVLPDTMTDLMGRHGGANTFEDFNGILFCGKTSQTAALLTDRNYVYTSPGETDFRYRYESFTEGETTGRRLWLIGYVGADTEVTIPSGIYGIKRFSGNTTASNWRTFYGDGFYGNETITRAVIPEGTVVIEDSAFRGCVNLTDITFPTSLKVLKNHAFEQCGSASETRHYYILPDDMTEISTNISAGWGAFTNINKGTLVCSYNSNTALLLSENYNFAPLGHQTDGLLYRYEKHDDRYLLYLWDYVGDAAEIVIPGDIGLYGVSRTPPGGSDSWHPAFYNNKTLKKIVIPEGVEIIQDSAFAKCTLLTDITLPSTLKIMKNHCFENTGTLAGKRFIVVLPASITEFTANNGAGWACFNNSGATLVSSNAYVSKELYDYWWQYYTSLADAEAQVHLCRKPNDDPNFEYNGCI